MLMMTLGLESPADHAKLEEVFETYGDLMFYVANRILNNEHDAEDAVQQALVAVYQNISKISEIKCPKTKSFIVTVVERKAIDLYRVKQRSGSVPLAEEYINVPAACEIEALVTRSTLSKAIAMLPTRYRELILLKYDHGYTDREIAGMCGMTEANVRKTVQRAKKKLETMLNEGGTAT